MVYKLGKGIFVDMGIFFYYIGCYILISNLGNGFNMMFLEVWKKRWILYEIDMLECDGRFWKKGLKD